MQRHWRKGCKHSTRGQFTYSTSGRISDRIDEIGSHLIQVKWKKDHATMEHVREGTITPRGCCRQTCLPTSRRRRARLHTLASNIANRATAQGRPSWLVEIQRINDVAPRLQRQRRVLLGILVVFQRQPRRKRSTHAKFSRTYTLPKTGMWSVICWAPSSSPRVQDFHESQWVAHPIRSLMRELSSARHHEETRTPYEKQFIAPFNGLSIPLGADISHKPVSQKVKHHLHQFDKW